MIYFLNINTLMGIVLTLATTIGVPSQAHSNERNRLDIVVAVNQLPRTLEPAEITGNIEVRVHYSMFDTLLRRDFLNPVKDDRPNLLPGLAEKWRRIDDQTVEVTLRRGVKFHNGDVLNADDVIFTFSKERLWGEKSLFSRGRIHFSTLKQVLKIDEHTIRFITKYPDPLFEQKLAGYTASVINARTWIKYNNGQSDWLKKALNSNRWNPIGTGPLKFKRRIKEKEITFTGHDSYFMGKPHFRSMTFKQVPDRNVRMAGMISGLYDIIVDVSPHRISTFNKYTDIDARSVVLDNIHVLVFNTKAPNLQDKRFRQALSLAIDRETLRRDLWLSLNFTPKGHQLQSYGKMYNPDRLGYTFDIERAKKLVRKSDYRGELLSYRVVRDYYLYSENAALMIIEMWRRIGVNAKLEIVENWETARSKGVEIYAWSNTIRLPDPAGGIMLSWGPESGIQKKYRFWKPPSEFNDLAVKLERSTHPQNRYITFNRLLDLFEDEMPGTLLYNPLYTYGVRSNIRWTPYTIYFMDFRPDVFSIR